MNNHKAPSSDNMQMELFQFGRERTSPKNLRTVFWTLSEAMPTSWTKKKNHKPYI